MINYESNIIGVTVVEEYQQELVNIAIKRHFKILKLAEQIKPDMKILLKPNLLMKRTPDEFTTTHPSILIGIINSLTALGVEPCNIIIADSPGGPYNETALKGIYKSTGMQQVADITGVTLNNDFMSRRAVVTNGVKLEELYLIKPVQDADFIIDVAKLKTHSMTGLSGGVKNLFGTIAGLKKPEFHFKYPNKKDFCDMLIDVCETVSPDVVFIDAIVSMQGDGPSAGTSKLSKMILSSQNPYNLDLALCRVIGFKPSEILTVQNAIERGLSVPTFKDLRYFGDKLLRYKDFQKPHTKDIKFYDQLPLPFQGIAKKFVDNYLISKPIIRKNECIGCAKCAESCPAQIITIDNKKAVIDYKKCIKCYCCHEMCPIKVIDLKKSYIAKILKM